MHVWEDYVFIYLLVYILIIADLKLKAHKSKSFILFFSIMYVYFLAVLKYTIFPIPYDEISIKVFSQGAEWGKRVNFIPFMINGKYTLSKTMLLNILLTITLGFGINFLFSKKLKFIRIFLIGCLAGITIELIQLIIGFNIGFPYRIIDMTDIICNLVGCILGYIGFLIFSRLWILLSKDVDTQNGIFKEVDCICKNTTSTKSINE